MALKQFTAWLTSLLSRYPAATAYGISAAAIPVLTTTLHWDTRQAAAATAIVTALSTIVVAIKARPFEFPMFLSGATAIAEAVAAFHVHIAASTISVWGAFATAVLGALVHGNLTPIVTLRPPAPKA